MIARKPFPADQRAVRAATEIKVPELALSYISVITNTIKELNALGKTCVKIFKIVLSCRLKKGTMLNRNIINGKKEMIIK